MIDGSLIGEVDSSLGECGDDLFGWAPTAFIAKVLAESR
jgi:hypothetical protein